jgi:hypothetical protein
VAVTEPDVESEIYERLYGVPERARHNGAPQEHPIVIVDGATLAGTGADEAHEDPVWASPVRRRPGAAVLAATLIAAIAEALAAAFAAAVAAARWAGKELRPALAAGLATARSAGKELRPAIDGSAAAARRRPAVAGGLAAALLAVPLVALLLSAGGSSQAARARLAPPSPHAALPSAQPVTPPAVQRRSPPQPTRTTTDAPAAPVPASSTGTDTAALQHRSSKAHVLTRRTSNRRPNRVASRPPSPAPIKRSTAQERPAQPPTTTTPTTPSGSGTNVTGGQAAPPD